MAKLNSAFRPKMIAKRFTVMLPVHREPVLFPFALESVLLQSHGDFELFVICDGAPPATVDCARSFAARDSRVRVFDFPKGEHHGERHRDTVLKLASGELVAQLGDDDLWFPDHLRELAVLLDEVEFGNLLMMALWPDGAPYHFPGDFADPSVRQKMATEKWNLFGPTVSGYRLSTYRRLPEGWTPAPRDIYSDLYMWRKFLRLDGITCATRFTIQALCLPSSIRPGMSLDERCEETALLMATIRDPRARAALVERYWESYMKAQIPTADLLAARDSEIAALRRKVAELEERTAGAKP